MFSHVHRGLGLRPGNSHRRLFGTSVGRALTHAVGASASALVILLYVFVLNNSDVHDFSFTVVLNIMFNALSSVFVTSPVTCVILNHGVGRRPTRRATITRIGWGMGGGRVLLFLSNRYQVRVKGRRSCGAVGNHFLIG